MKTPKVVIQIVGGVAEVVKKDKGVKVIISDGDCMGGGGCEKDRKHFHSYSYDAEVLI